MEARTVPAHKLDEITAEEIHKMPTQPKSRRPVTINLIEEPQERRLVKVAETVWNESYMLEGNKALMKKYESLGWCCFAARKVAEGYAERGGLLYRSSEPKAPTS